MIRNKQKSFKCLRGLQNRVRTCLKKNFGFSRYVIKFDRKGKEVIP